MQKLGTIRRMVERASGKAERALWRVECSPHIGLRMRRIFGKLTREDRGVLVLGDNIENCRDLAWFLDRYPLGISPEDRAYLLDRERAHMLQGEDVDAILKGRYNGHAFELAIPARDYQKQAAAILLRTGALLLADDLGIGKTVSAICALTDPGTRPALVVTMTHLPRQWEGEIKKFAPGLRVHCLRKGTPYDICRPPRVKRSDPEEKYDALPDVIISNYHKLAGWAGALAPIIKTVIFDEAQELRRVDSLKYEAAQTISDGASYRMGLTATPVYNYGGEIFSVLDCIKPGALGTREEFKLEHCTDHGNHLLISDPRAFGSYMREEGLLLRRTRADVGHELPPLTKIPHYIDIDGTQLDYATQGCAELCRFILSTANEGRGAKMRAGGELDYKLRQATGIAKAKYVAQFCQMLLEGGEKNLVLFGWHHEVYRIWCEWFQKLGISFAMYTGKEPARKKELAKAAFLAGEAKVLVMSLRAGAGLDGLQEVCRTGVIGELDWSPQVMDQDVGRLHRFGQEQSTIAYYLIAESGSDPVIADVLGLKRSQSEPLVNPGAALVTEGEVDPERITRLAEAFMKQRGLQ
jgi:SNF2 family DNA or RNA helicase